MADALGRRPPPDVGQAWTVPSPAFRFDWQELSGAFADAGIIVAIAVELIVQNRLSPTAVLLPAGILYLAVAVTYRLPVPVQPMKAVAAIAIAQGLSESEIAAGALLIGMAFLVLGATGAIDLAALLVPLPVVRGIQISVGLLFMKIAADLVRRPQMGLADRGAPTSTLLLLTVVVLVGILLLRQRHIVVCLLAVAVAISAWRSPVPLSFGPSALHLPSISVASLQSAAVVLLLPQLPLTFANSCLATADVATRYYGDAAGRVRPGRLARSLGSANLLAGIVCGMPVCHGAAGMTAHHAFGARTGGAPLMVGGLLVGLAVFVGGSLGAFLSGFPVPILAGLLGFAGLLHLKLARDLSHPGDWALAVAVAVLGVRGHLAVAIAAGTAVWWTVRLAVDRRAGS